MLGETSFYTEEELPLLRLASYGRDVRISRKTSFYAPEQMHLGSHVRIDDFCISENVYPDIVKVDVEGFEWEVLKGFGDLLRKIKLFFIL